LLNPTSEIGVFLIPVRIPGFIFGILYLWFSSYEARRARDNIDHMAHFFGALFGFFFPMILKPSLFSDFIEQLRNWL
jgi:membrane associated rhomboid family serine protease